MKTGIDFEKEVIESPAIALNGLPMVFPLIKVKRRKTGLFAAEISLVK